MKTTTLEIFRDNGDVFVIEAKIKKLWIVGKDNKDYSIDNLEAEVYGKVIDLFQNTLPEEKETFVTRGEDKGAGIKWNIEMYLEKVEEILYN